MEEVQKYTTNDLSELIKALCRAKKEFKPITKDGKNPFLNSKYVTLDAIINATEDALADNGLVIMHHQELIDDNKFLVTELIHESGQSKSTETCMNEYIQVSLNDKGNAKVTLIQVLGSIVTYLRRYHISELLNIAIDEDNDGNGMDHGKGKQSTEQSKTNQQDNLDKISQTEIDHITEALKELGIDGVIPMQNKVTSILKRNIQSISDLTMPEYTTVMKALGSSKVPGGKTEDKADKNRRRAFAIANKLLMNDQQIVEQTQAKFSIDSRTEMTEGQWAEYGDSLLEYEKVSITKEQIAELKTLPKPYNGSMESDFLNYANTVLAEAVSKTKHGDGSAVAHTPITKIEYMDAWQADYIIRVLKASKG